jgi:hypothetical protein
MSNRVSSISTTPKISYESLSENVKIMFTKEDFNYNDKCLRLVLAVLHQNIDNYEKEGYNVLIKNVNELTKFCILKIYQEKADWETPDDIYNWIICRVYELITLSKDHMLTKFKKQIWRSTFVFFSLLLARCFELNETLKQRLVNNSHNSTHYQLIVRLGITSPDNITLSVAENQTKDIIDFLISFLIPNKESDDKIRLMNIAAKLLDCDRSTFINFQRAAIEEVIDEVFYFLSPLNSFLGAQTIFKGLNCQILIL